MQITRVTKQQERKERIIAGVIAAILLGIATVFFLKSFKKEEKPSYHEVISTEQYSGEGILIDQEVLRTQEWLRERETIVTPGEYRLLCKLVYATSSRTCSMENTAITAVIINRLKSDKFPNTIREVLTETGQFTLIDSECNVYWFPEANHKAKLQWSEVSEEVKADVKLALTGFDPTNGATFFYSKEYISPEEEAKRKNIKYVQYGDTVFYTE